MLKEKQSEKMMSKEEQLSEGPWYIHEQVSQHTKAAQDERVHRQEQMEKMHQVLQGSLQAGRKERGRFEAGMQQTTARMGQQISLVREQLQIVEAGSQARQEAVAGETVTGTAVRAETGSSVLGTAKKTSEGVIRGFAETESVRTDAQVKKMLGIDDDNRWEQSEETKGARTLQKSMLDGRPMRAGSVLFSGECEDGTAEPLGISLLELVQRVVEAVHRTKLSK